MRLSTLQFASSSLNPALPSTAKENRVIRDNVWVRFNKATADNFTGEFWQGGREYELPDQQAMRHVEAGNAEYLESKKEIKEAQKAAEPAVQEQGSKKK
jgi:hypothetical protein